MKNIPGVAAFLRVCELTKNDLLNSAPSLKLAEDGVYINKPEDEELGLLSAVENRAVSELPPWQESENDPALKFPCTIKQFTDFMDWAGLSECINKEELTILSNGGEKAAEASCEGNKKGGRPPENLKEAIEKVYLKIHKEGRDIYLLKENNIRAFLKEFKKIVDSENGNISDYVRERIKTVEIKPAEIIITTQRKDLGNGNYKEGRKYGQNAVAKIFSNLREKYPI